MSETFPFQGTKTQSLPDSEGTPVGRGDWVTDDEGQEFRVVDLHPREAHSPNNLSKKTGEVDRVHSYVTVARYRRHGDADLPFGNLDGEVQTGRGLMRLTRLDLTETEYARRDLERVDIFLHNVGIREAQLAGKRRTAESLRLQLLAKLTTEVTR